MVKNHEKMINEFKRKIKNKEVISLSKTAKKYKISHQTVYNVAEKNGINIPEYNRSLKETDYTVSEREDTKAKEHEEVIKEGNGFQITRRVRDVSSTFKELDKQAANYNGPKFNFKINPQFVDNKHKNDSKEKAEKSLNKIISNEIKKENVPSNAEPINIEAADDYIHDYVAKQNNY